MTMTPRHRTTYLLAALLVALGTAVSTGCGDDAGPGSAATNNEVTNNGDGDNNGGDNNGGPDLTLPAELSIAFDPPRSVYVVGTALQPSATVYDGNGDVIAGADVDWTVEPTSNFEMDGARYKISAEGDLSFTACTTAAGIDGSPVCRTKTVVADDSAPTVEVTSPEPGAWLGADGSQAITVEGVVTDTHGEPSAFVNGRRVDVDAQGNFSTTIEPRFGINHIEVVASDGVNSATGDAILDVLWAPAWHDMSNTQSETAFEFSDGLALDLGQRFFDDGQRPQNPNESTLVTEDLADVFTLLLKNVDFLGQIPDPVLDTSSGQLRITDLTIGEPDVLLELTDTGAELYLWVPNVDIQTQGAVALDQTVLDLTGSINASVVGFAVLELDKAGADQDFTASVSQLEVSLQGAESSFVSAEANAVFKLAESALRSTIEDILVDTLRGQFIDTLPGLLVDALNSVEEQIAGVSFDLDTEFTDPLTLSLDGGIETFETRYRDSLLAKLQTRVSANQAPALTTSPGIPLAVPFSQELPFFETSRAQVGVRLALLNGLLHTLWETGFLEIDLTNLMPDQYANLTDEANLSVKLQPVLSEPRAGQPYDFLLRAGQMELEVHLPNQVDVYAVNIEVGILMSLVDNSISITVPDDPVVTAWVKSTTGDRAFLSQGAVEDLILGQVWPQIEETLRQGLAFELPVPSLSGLSDLAPTLTALDLELMLERPVAFRDGFIIFDTMLYGTLPLGQ